MLNFFGQIQKLATLKKQTSHNSLKLTQKTGIAPVFMVFQKGFEPPTFPLGEFPGTVILFTQFNKEKCDKSRSLASLIIKIVLNKKHSI